MPENKKQNTEKPKTIRFITLGCKVNQYESQDIRERFLEIGYKDVSEGPYDICVVNTCCVTDRAEKKARQFISRIRKESPGSVLVVTGCGADYNPGIFKDGCILVPNKEKSGIPALFGHTDCITCGITRFAGHKRAFVKIQDGCSEFCSYCVIPYARGAPRSRQADVILEEVKRLASNGYREVVLTGINLGNYNGLEGLVMLLDDIPGLLRIRLSSIEPLDITESLMDAVSRNKKVCRHFHIPLQSGSDRVLRLMNRKYIFSEYRDVIDKITDRFPYALFSTDVIAGFPGETEKDFSDTCGAVEEIGFSKVHIFPYSGRRGTAAYSYKDKIPQAEIKRRCRFLKKVSCETASSCKKKLIGTVQEVILESLRGRLSGYTEGYIPVKMRHTIPQNIIQKNLGQMVKVLIDGVSGGCLLGKFLVED